MTESVVHFLEKQRKKKAREQVAQARCTDPASLGIAYGEAAEEEKSAIQSYLIREVQRNLPLDAVTYMLKNHNKRSPWRLFGGYLCLCLFPEVAALISIYDSHPAVFHELPGNGLKLIQIASKFVELMDRTTNGVEPLSTIMNKILDEFSTSIGLRLDVNITRGAYGTTGWGNIKVPMPFDRLSRATMIMQLPELQSISHYDNIAWATISDWWFIIQADIRREMLGQATLRTHHPSLPIVGRNTVQEIERVAMPCSCSMFSEKDEATKRGAVREQEMQSSDRVNPTDPIS